MISLFSKIEQTYLPRKLSRSRKLPWAVRQINGNVQRVFSIKYEKTTRLATGWKLLTLALSVLNQLTLIWLHLKAVLTHSACMNSYGFGSNLTQFQQNFRDIYNSHDSRIRFHFAAPPTPLSWMCSSRHLQSSMFEHRRHYLQFHHHIQAFSEVRRRNFTFES